MTVQEFSDSFDVLLNSYAHSADFGDAASRQDVVLDEYEKSVFLTEAQEQLVLSYYAGKNSLESFEETEEVRRYLNNLVVTKEYTSGSGLTLNSSGTNTTAPTRAKSYLVEEPADLWFIVYESARYATTDTCIDAKTAEITPVTHDTFSRVFDNPFKGPNLRRVLRLDRDGKIELISKHDLGRYLLRYVKKLEPIILIDLPEGLKIDEKYTAQGCALHKALHRPILELAVRLALQSKGYNIDKK